MFNNNKRQSLTVCVGAWTCFLPTCFMSAHRRYCIRKQRAFLALSWQVRESQHLRGSGVKPAVPNPHAWPFPSENSAIYKSHHLIPQRIPTVFLWSTLMGWPSILASKPTSLQLDWGRHWERSATSCHLILSAGCADKSWPLSANNLGLRLQKIRQADEIEHNGFCSHPRISIWAVRHRERRISIWGHKMVSKSTCHQARSRWKPILPSLLMMLAWFRFNLAESQSDLAVVAVVGLCVIILSIPCQINQRINQCVPFRWSYGSCMNVSVPYFQRTITTATHMSGVVAAISLWKYSRRTGSHELTPPLHCYPTIDSNWATRMTSYLPPGSSSRFSCSMGVAIEAQAFHGCRHGSSTGHYSQMPHTPYSPRILLEMRRELGGRTEVS